MKAETMPENEPQGYAIELFFDETTEKAILAFRESIYQAGVTPVLGSLKDRPHISLAVFGRQEPQHLIRIAERFALQCPPMPVDLSALGSFPTDSNVVFLLPVVTTTLLGVHRDLHQILEEEKINSSHYYLPGHWVPHCTLESDLADDQLNLAIHLCQKNFQPLSGNLTAVGVIAFRPLDYLAEFSLTKKE